MNMTDNLLLPVFFFSTLNAVWDIWLAVGIFGDVPGNPRGVKTLSTKSASGVNDRKYE